MSTGYENRPNIIVITTDQQRYDSLGVTGNTIVHTPNLDRLASNGVLFSRAYCQNTVCIPSRACLHTGRYTHQHGVQYMESEIDTTPTLPPWEKTFMERLQDAGYRTSAVGKIHMMQPKGYHETALCGGKGSRWKYSIGQDIGPAPLGPTYARWLEKRRPGGYEEIYQQRREPEYSEYRTAIVNVLSEDEYVEAWIAEEAKEFINRRKTDVDPFMLWIGFCGPHGPFDPPKRYADMYSPEDMLLPESYTFNPDDAKGPTPETVKRIIARYYALVSCVDEKIGEIVDALEKNGQWENTVVVYTSDHGEMLGDKNRFGKGCFYEPVIRMPTIMSHPQSRKASTYDGLVETFSIAPTLLECAGIDIPVQMSAESLFPVLAGEQTDGSGGRESVLCEYVPNDRSRIQMCVRTESNKLVLDYPIRGSDLSDPMYELYNLDEDPLETENRYDDPSMQAVREELKDIGLNRILETSTPAYNGWLHQMPQSLREQA